MDVLICKGMYLTIICLFCYGNGESISHILIHCLFVADIWNAMWQDFGMTWPALPNMTSLLSSWKSTSFNAKGKRIWRMVPAVVWWSVWQESNNRVFENAAGPLFQVYRKASICFSFGLEIVRIVIMIKGEEAF